MNAREFYEKNAENLKEKFISENVEYCLSDTVMGVDISDIEHLTAFQDFVDREYEKFI